MFIKPRIEPGLDKLGQQAQTQMSSEGDRQDLDYHESEAYQSLGDPPSKPLPHSHKIKIHAPQDKSGVQSELLTQGSQQALTGNQIMPAFKEPKNSKNKTAHNSGNYTDISKAKATKQVDQSVRQSLAAKRGNQLQDINVLVDQNTGNASFLNDPGTVLMVKRSSSILDSTSKRKVRRASNHHDSSLSNRTSPKNRDLEALQVIGNDYVQMKTPEKTKDSTQIKGERVSIYSNNKKRGQQQSNDTGASRNVQGNVETSLIEMPFSSNLGHESKPSTMMNTRTMIAHQRKSEFGSGQLPGQTERTTEG